MNEIRHDFEKICYVSKEFKENFNFKMFIWAHTCVSKFRYQGQINGIKVDYMVPLTGLQI